MHGKQIARAQKIIDEDRLGLVVGSEELIRRDVTGILKEYFNLTAPVYIGLEKSGDRILVRIETECSGVKKFVIMP